MSYHESLRPVSIKLALTSNCNLNCTYCDGPVGRAKLSTPAAMEDYRAEHISTGSISTDQLLQLFKEFSDRGFASVRPTGGEPTLRHDWDYVVDTLAKTGYQGVDITTNGMLLSHYLDNHGGKLPEGLSTVKVSLDTYDPEEFKCVTRGGDLNKIMDGVSRISGQTWVRANTVVLRSNTTPEKIKGLIDFCQGLGMKQIQFLDLVYYPNLPSANPKFWEEQFVAWPEFARVFKQIYPEAKFTEPTNQFGVNFHRTELSNGFVVTFKDSTSTMRDPKCATCPLYCQEGRCLVRVATDGNVTFCPDYKAELPHFNGIRTLQDGTFDQKVDEIADIVESSVRMRTIEIFAQKHNLKLPDEI